MRTINLEIPDGLEMSDGELLVMFASQLYEKGKLSLGQAAELAHLTKRAFAEVIGDYGVSIFNFPASELQNDVLNA